MNNITDFILASGKGFLFKCMLEARREKDFNEIDKILEEVCEPEIGKELFSLEILRKAS